MSRPPFVPLTALRRAVETDGQTLRRAVRRVGARTVKDDAGHLWVATEAVPAVLTEAVRRGARRRERV